jgi:GNAT superfamily N-acetyltransferase
MRGAANRFLAILDGPSVEAMMLIDLSKASRLQTGSYTPLVYVDNVAVAPWNRPQIQTVPRYRGLGKLMLGAAVSLAIEEGMDGRCGLHSLVQAEGFYLRAGMQDLGLDAAVENLRYFEFSPTAARKFLEL